MNNTAGRSVGPVLEVQFDTRDNLLANNVFVAGDSHSFVDNGYTPQGASRDIPVCRTR